MVAFGQVTITISVPGETSVTATFSAEMISAGANAITSNYGTGSPINSTVLTQANTVNNTTFTVASTTGVTVGMGALIGGEVSLITAIPSGTTLTVQRARISTTAVTASAGSQVVYLQSGDYGQFIKSVIKAWSQQYLTQFPGPTITNAQSTIAANQAAIIAALAAAVQ